MQTDTRGEARVPGRQGRVWSVLVEALQSVSTPGRPPVVLDCGGGSGSFAVPLAQQGAQVTVVDISADALATLRRRAVEAGVADRVRAVQGDIEALADALAPVSFDLVLAHGILESVDHPAAAFEAIASALHVGAKLSVLVGNPVASVLTRALSGDLTAALAEFRAIGGFDTPGPETVRALCHSAGLLVEAVYGVGVFTDIVPGRALDAPGAREALAELEAACSARSPFTEIASRVHVLAGRPAP